MRSELDGTWRYRIVREDDYLTLREVHDTPDGQMWSATPRYPGGENVSILSGDIMLMLRAFQEPVLEVKDGELVVTP